MWAKYGKPIFLKANILLTCIQNHDVSVRLVVNVAIAMQQIL